MNITHLRPANIVKGYVPMLGATADMVTSVYIPTMRDIITDNQGSQKTCGLRLKIESLRALGMTNQEIVAGLQR